MSASAPRQSDRPRRAVILSGGGARGAYEAGVLRFILDDLPQRHGIDPNFDIVCGTSVGAIHAAFIAATAEQKSGRGPQANDPRQGREPPGAPHMFQVRGTD